VAVYAGLGQVFYVDEMIAAARLEDSARAMN
jgi:hypothetical protein